MSGSNPFRRDRPFAQAPASVPPATEQDDHIDASTRFPSLNIDSKLQGPFLQPMFPVWLTMRSSIGPCNCPNQARPIRFAAGS